MNMDMNTNDEATTPYTEAEKWILNQLKKADEGIPETVWNELNGKVKPMKGWLKSLPKQLKPDSLLEYKLDLMTPFVYDWFSNPISRVLETATGDLVATNGKQLLIWHNTTEGKGKDEIQHIVHKKDSGSDLGNYPNYLQVVPKSDMGCGGMISKEEGLALLSLGLIKKVKGRISTVLVEIEGCFFDANRLAELLKGLYQIGGPVPIEYVLDDRGCSSLRLDIESNSKATGVLGGVNVNSINHPITKRSYLTYTLGEGFSGTKYWGKESVQRAIVIKKDPKNFCITRIEVPFSMRVSRKGEESILTFNAHPGLLYEALRKYLGKED